MKTTEKVSKFKKGVYRANQNRNKKLTQKRLKEILHYNPETGVFTNVQPRPLCPRGKIIGTTCKKHGYVLINICGKTEYAHRLAFLYILGYMPGREVDHIDHNRSNNAWANLREVDKTYNSRNRKLSCKNQFGCFGITKTKKGYQATINRQKIGVFETLEEAIKARKEAEQKLGYSKNHGQLLMRDVIYNFYKNLDLQQAA